MLFAPTRQRTPLRTARKGQDRRSTSMYRGHRVRYIADERDPFSTDSSPVRFAHPPRRQRRAAQSARASSLQSNSTCTLTSAPGFRQTSRLRQGHLRRHSGKHPREPWHSSTTTRTSARCPPDLGNTLCFDRSTSESRWNNSVCWQDPELTELGPSPVQPLEAKGPRIP